MKTLYYSQVSGFDTQSIINDIEKYNPTEIVLFCETEWECAEMTWDFAQYLNTKRVKVIVVHCSYPSEFYATRYKGFSTLELKYWPTYWANWSVMCSRNIQFNVKYEDFKFPFISLNNKNHTHRCILIDELARNDLLDKGLVTWHRFPNQTPSAYPFKYFDDRVITIGDEFETKLDSFLIPNEYHQSFLHVIGESTTSVTCISEKTWLPIMFKKPWVIMADPGFHKKLVDLGFELYDEIIDYSFDSEPDMIKRGSMISDNVKSVVEQGNWFQLYESIKDKAQRNYENFLRIVTEPKYVPQLYIDRARHVKSVNYEGAVFTDPRYVHICETMNLI